jgi:acetyl-CoA synthetase
MAAVDEKNLMEVAQRIREMREITGLTVDEMAAKTDVSVEEYMLCEAGKSDLNFTFIYRCALALGVDVTDIIEGFSPNLKSYTVTRRGSGQKVSQAHGMTYYNLAYAFQNRIAEPLYVKSKYNPAAQNQPMELTTHDGQEIDIVIEGKKRASIFLMADNILNTAWQSHLSRLKEIGIYNMGRNITVKLIVTIP